MALLGDIAYPEGSVASFTNCFDPAWRVSFDRLRPSPGNHEYLTPGGAGYFEYFGERAGDPAKGWYSYDLGDYWRVIVLNSNCAAIGGCARDSLQGRWLSRTLAGAEGRHVVAYWHTARFSTGEHGSNDSVGPFWEQLYEAGAEIVLSGHEHIYERFAPQTPEGQRSSNGIRQFTVGTGGRELYRYSRPPLATTEVRNNTTYGVLQLRLLKSGYSWRFIPAVGSFTDSGSHRVGAQDVGSK